MLCYPWPVRVVAVYNLDECADADFKKLTDFRISTIKPLTPRWLYIGWKHIADDPDMVVRGWRKCGLREPFDSNKYEVLKKAQLAMTDPEHPLFPLFPNGDRTQLPPEVLQGEMEPALDQAGDPDEDAAAEDLETEQRVRELLAAAPAPPQPDCSGDVAMGFYPMVNLAEGVQGSTRAVA